MLSKTEILFELRSHIHFLTTDELNEILNDDVENIVNDGGLIIKFACNKKFITYSRSSKFWFLGDDLHRESDKPAVIKSDGSMEWWVNGKLIKKT